MTMATDRSYNGWTNYESWCVALWLGNDESTYHKSIKVLEDAATSNSDYPLAAQCDALKEYVDDLAESACKGSRTGASFVCDLLGAALSEVNWLEVVESYAEVINA